MAAVNAEMGKIFDPADHHHLIGRTYTNNEGAAYSLHGILLGEDDWYWQMVAEGEETRPRICYLSCVCDPEAYGFERVD